jgi:Pyridoxamine 5'-phosphate oxidase
MVGMNGPTFDVLGFLGEPGRPSSVATVTGRGRPALAMMWFLMEDHRLWFHTPEVPGLPAPFIRAAREGAPVAVMVATFSPPTDVRQVRMTGPARLEERDDARVRRLYGRYVDAWTPKWERQATLASYRLWSMSPERGMAVTYPDLRDGPTYRWSEPSGLFGLGA